MVLQDSANANVSRIDMREILANMLVFVVRSNHKDFFDRHINLLSEDYLYDAGLVEPTVEIINAVLISLSDQVSKHGYNLYEDFGIPEPNREMVNIPRIIHHECNNDIESLKECVERNNPFLTEEQNLVVQAVRKSIEQDEGKIISLDAPGGTGKSFVLTHLLNLVRSRRSLTFFQKNIV